MFHNPFRPATHSAPAESGAAGLPPSDKSAQTHSFTNKATQTHRRASGPRTPRGAQTCSQKIQTSRDTQTYMCVLKPTKKCRGATKQTEKQAPQPTKPEFPLSMYGAPRLFPTFEVSHMEKPKSADVDLYASAGGYVSSHAESNESDCVEKHTDQRIGSNKCGSIPCEEPADSESSECAVFSSSAD